MSDKGPSDPPDEAGAVVARLPPAGESSSSSPNSSDGGNGNGGDTSKDVRRPLPGKRVSDEDLKMMDEKRQRRIMANRKSARESRDRRLRYTAQLEKTVEQLKQQNTALERQNEILVQEVRVLQTENTVMAQTLAGAGLLGSIPSGLRMGMDPTPTTGAGAGADGLSSLLGAAGVNPQPSMIGASQGMPPLSTGLALGGLSATGARPLLNAASATEQAEFGRLQEEEEARPRAALLPPQQQLQSERSVEASDEEESKKNEPSL